MQDSRSGDLNACLGGCVRFAAVLVVGYIAGYPALAWLLRDLGRYRSPVWVGYGDPSTWRNAARLSYAVGGWPVLAVACAWRTGKTRSALNSQRQFFHDEHTDDQESG